MERKPIQILVIALIQLFNPIANVLINSWQFHLPPMTIVRSVWHSSSYFTSFEFFLVGPLSAIAIYSVKKWSYPVFLLCSFLTLGSNLSTWSRYPNSISLSLLLAVCALNIALVTYFILPAVRLAYFEPRLRWWEAKPRYHHPILATFGYGNTRTVGRIMNFSEGGAFISVEQSIEPGTHLNLQFEMNGQVFRFEGKVVYFRKDGNRGCGVQFEHNTDTKKLAKAAVRELKRAGASRQPAQRNLFKELIALLPSAVRGKGLVPELSPAAKAKRQNSDNQATEDNKRRVA